MKAEPTAVLVELCVVPNQYRKKIRGEREHAVSNLNKIYSLELRRLNFIHKNIGTKRTVKTGRRKQKSC